MTAAIAKVVNLRDFAVDAGFEDGVHREVGVGVGGYGANLGAHRARVADGHADHGATVDGRCADLIGRFEVRIEAAIGIDAGVEDEAEIERVAEDAIKELPAEFGELLLALFVPEEIGLALRDRDIGVHAAAVDSGYGFGKEAGAVAVVVGDLTAEELVELNLVGRGHNFGVSEVDFELAGCDLGMVLFVLETHGALHLSGGVDELAERVERQRVVVAAGVYELELAGLMEDFFRLLAGEEEAFDLSGGVEGVSFFGVELVGVIFEDTAHVARVRRSILIDDDAKDENLTVAEDVGGNPVKGAPINAKAEVALALSGEATNGRAIESEIFVGAKQKLLVVIEQMQASFEIREEDGDSFDPLLVCEIFQPLLANLLDGQPAQAILLRLQIELFRSSS